MANGAPDVPPPGGLPPDGDEELSADERTWAVWAHLLGGLSLFVGISFIGPLIVWLVKKEDGAFVEDQSREALNFHLTLFVALLLGAALVFCGAGFVVLPILWVAGVVLSVIGAMKANEGVRYRYPWTFRLVS